MENNLYFVSMKSLRIFIILVVVFLPNFLLAQGGEGNMWYFGDHAGIDFNTGAAVALTDGAINTQEGCASICDPGGNLLFYTDGRTVWNANHLPMSNSTAGSLGGVLGGDASSTQSGVIVPMPNNPNFYFVFTVDANIGSEGCRYSVINMSLNGGLGNVVLTQKNILLFTPSSEKISAVKHANGIDIWVITHPWNSGTFFAYLVTSTGLNATPVQSTVGSIYSGSSANTRGYLKSSPNGTYVCAGIEGLDKWELFSFNNATGILAPLLFTPSSWSDAYGIEFSPDETRMYGSRRWGAPIFQWNLTLPTPGAIQASMTQIGSLGTGAGGALGLAPDGKIYCAKDGFNYLGVINDPNSLGTACNFVSPGFYLGSNNVHHCHEGLPTFISSYFNIADYSFQNQCFGDFTEFAISDTILLDSAFWYFDDPMSGAANISWDYFPTHIFSSSGVFDVTLITYRVGIGDTVTYPVEIYAYPDFNLGPDTSICTGSTIILNASSPGATYLWDNGATTATISVTPWDTITYYVEATSHDCTSYDSIMVMPFNITSNFTMSSIDCFGDDVTVTYTGNAIPTANYQWNWAGANIISGSGAGPYVVNWSNPGNYTVSLNISQGSCTSGSSSGSISNPPELEVSITGNDVICHGESTGEIFLAASGGDGAYSFSWDAGYNDQNLLGVPAGVYNVTVSYNSVCTVTATYTLDEPSSPVASSLSGNSINCYGETNGYIDLTPSGGVPPYTYAWSYNNRTTQDLQDLAAGYYTVTVWDSNNCPATSGVSIIEPAQIGITASVDEMLCEGQSATMHAFPFGGTPAYSVFWIGAGSGDSILVSPSSTTTYSVYAIDDNMCYSDTARVTIGVYPPVYTLASASFDTICYGEHAYIDADFTGGNGGPYTCMVDGELVALPVLVTPETTTTYIVEGRDDCESPALTMAIKITVMDLPPNVFDTDIKSGCQPLEITFTQSNFEDNQSYVWLFGENGDFGYSVDKDPTHIFENFGLYDISLTTTSGFGCVNTFRVPEMIEVYKKPEALFLPDQNRVGIKSPVVYFDNLSVDAVNCSWDFGDGVRIFTDFPTTSHVYSDTGIFNVTLIVESSYSCLDTIILPVEVFDETNFNAPNAIYPNSSNAKNTVFKPSIYGINPNDYHMIIYDRWGEKIFESFNYLHGWDGRVKNGEIAKEGSYLWFVTYKDEKGLNKQETGSVTLLR